MLDFFKSLFKPQGSGATAKERLRLVLLSDHIALAPDVVEALRNDLLAVIARYVEFDEKAAEVTFETREREVAMLASVPILRVKTERPSKGLEPAQSGPAQNGAAPGGAPKPRSRRRRRRAAAPGTPTPAPAQAVPPPLRSSAQA